MSRVINLDRVSVISGQLAVRKLSLNGRQDATTRVALVQFKVRLGNDELLVIVLIVFTTVGGIPVVLLELGVTLPLAQLVASFAGHQVVDVGTNVPSTEGRQIPVGRNRGNLGVVVIETVVFSANKLSGDGITDQDAENLVADGVDFALVPGDEDKGVLHEVLVAQQRLEEVAGPATGGGDVGVVAVRGHVGGDEHPLGELVGLEVLVEVRLGLIVAVEGLEAGETLLVSGDALE